MRNSIGKIKYSVRELQTAKHEVFEYLEKPLTMWEQGDYNKQRLLLGMYFEKKIAYNPEVGFQTSDLPLMLAIAGGQNASKNNLVEMAGVKPASRKDYFDNYSQA